MTSSMGRTYGAGNQACTIYGTNQKLVMASTNIQHFIFVVAHRKTGTAELEPGGKNDVTRGVTQVAIQFPAPYFGFLEEPG